MTNLVEMTFRGDTLYVMEINGEPYVPVKPICEALGIAWEPQFRKITDGGKRWRCDLTAIPSAGGLQETICLPLMKVPSWLMTISPRRVRADIRGKLEIYQEELDRALWDFVSKGVAVNPRLAGSPGKSAFSAPRALPSPPPMWPRRRGGPSVFDHDLEVRGFIEQLLATPATYTEIAEVTRQRFGESRAPSRSAIGRYSLTLRPSPAPIFS
jgi:hypothetical protein